MESAEELEQRLDKYIIENCICQTCRHGIEEDLFNVYCGMAGMAGGWNPKTSCCEEHDFRDKKMENELQNKMNDWYVVAFPDLFGDEARQE